MQRRIAIVEDEDTMRLALRASLASVGYGVVMYENAEQALHALGEGEKVDLVISDVRMPGMDGLEFLRRARRALPALPFIMMSGYATVPEAVAAMKGGAYDFLVKPFSHRELLSLVEAALRPEEEEPSATQAGLEAGPLRGKSSLAFKTAEIITVSPRMQALLQFASEVAKSQASVLIQGESGTGKELLARFLHTHSRRPLGPFVAVNCAALPEGLLESEMFGYERGAFTGATLSKPGKFELAQGGSLLLDEVSEMPLSLQAKLLRALQEREVDRVGGRKPIKVDVRIIATTNRDLSGMVHAGTFREDLFYRLHVIPLYIPPLRERMEDLQPLAQAFLSRSGYPQASLSAEALERLYSHPWRGNVRELFNVLERAAILARGGRIGPEHLLLEEGWNPEKLRSGKELPSPPPSSQEEDRIRAGVSVQEMEAKLIFKTLAEVHQNRTQAAKLLGISVRTLRNKLKQYQKSWGYGEEDGLGGQGSTSPDL